MLIESCSVASTLPSVLLKGKKMGVTTPSCPFLPILPAVGLSQWETSHRGMYVLCDFRKAELHPQDLQGVLHGSLENGLC